MTALRIAHRGDWRAAPENTIQAFEAALRIPTCDGVEFDVRPSRDGRAILLHDDDLERVQGVKARADSLTAHELSHLGVPTLARALDAVGREPFLDVEIKSWVPEAIDLLESSRGPQLPRTVISSFHADILSEVARRRPAWATWLNIGSLDTSRIDQAVELGCRGISAEWHSITRGGIADVAARGLDLAAWTVRRPQTYRRLERLGIVAMCVEAAALDG